METKGRKQYTLLMSTKQQLTELQAAHDQLAARNEELAAEAERLREAAQAAEERVAEQAEVDRSLRAAAKGLQAQVRGWDCGGES